MGNELNDEFSGFTKAFVEEAKPAEPQVQKPVVETEVKTEGVETPPPTEPKVETPDFFSSLNEKLKTDFKSEEDIKVLIENASKAKQLEEQLKELETLKADIEFYKTGVDPLEYFASEDDYRIQQFKKANPDKDSTIAYKVFASDIDKLSDLDVLTQYEMLNNDVEGGEAGAKELIAQQYSLDLESDPKDWSTLTRNQIKKAANVVRKEIKEMKESYKLPEKIDVAGKRKAEQEALALKAETIKKGWSDLVPKMLSELKEVEINDYNKEGNPEPLLKYVVDDEFKAKMGQEAIDFLVANNKEINEANVKEAGGIIQREYVLRNLGKILKAYATTLVAEVDKKKDEEAHNPTVIKTETKPITSEDKAKQDLIDYALGGQSFKYNKPFN